MIAALPSPSTPKLGKLPFVPIVDLLCNTNALEKVFQGDPGSVYLGNCPGGCTSAPG